MLIQCLASICTACTGDEDKDEVDGMVQTSHSKQMSVHDQLMFPVSCVMYGILTIADAVSLCRQLSSVCQDSAGEPVQFRLAQPVHAQPPYLPHLTTTMNHDTRT